MRAVRVGLAAALLWSPVVAGGAGNGGAWLGRSGDIADTPWCRAGGCRLTAVQRNTPDTLGWPDGERRTYRLRGGARLEVEVRPAGWISTARLMFPGSSAMTADQHALSARFLGSVTGRAFRTEAIAACEQRGLALRDPDAPGPVRPLSEWTTPGGLPYRARCGVGAERGVWAGWRQQ